jgi:hypothetical protein
MVTEGELAGFGGSFTFTIEADGCAISGEIHVSSATGIIEGQVCDGENAVITFRNEFASGVGRVRFSGDTVSGTFTVTITENSLGAIPGTYQGEFDGMREVVAPMCPPDCDGGPPVRDAGRDGGPLPVDAGRDGGAPRTDAGADGGPGPGSCGDGTCGPGESCDGRASTVACIDCDGVSSGPPSGRYCYVEGACQGAGCP